MTIVGMFFVRQLPDGNVHAGEVVESLSELVLRRAV